MKQWELWMASFPYEEDPSILKKRPVIILNVNPLQVLSVKVTGQDARDEDEYDTPIVHWRAAGLNRRSVARISKSMNLSHDKFIHKIGDLDHQDATLIMQRFVDFINNRN